MLIKPKYGFYLKIILISFKMSIIELIIKNIIINYDLKKFNIKKINTSNIDQICGLIN